MQRYTVGTEINELCNIAPSWLYFGIIYDERTPEYQTKLSFGSFLSTMVKKPTQSLPCQLQ